MWKINRAKKNLNFEIKFSKSNFQILKLFKTLNLVNKILLIKKKNNDLYILIHLYYFKTLSVGTNFKILSTPSKSFYISLKALKLLSKRTGNSIFLISNSQNMADHPSIIKQKNGGLLLGFFSF